LCSPVGLRGHFLTRRGFTLVEMLVTISVIGVLMSLILPAVQSAREAARATECRNHLRQLGVAFQGYHAALRTFPPAEIHGNLQRSAFSGRHCDWVGSIGSWSAFLLPYIEQKPAYDRLDFEVFPQTGSAGNLDVMQMQFTLYQCPSDPEDGLSREWNDVPNEISRVMHYFAVSGSAEFGMPGYADGYNPPDLHCYPYDGAFYNDSRVRLSDITDGTSHTALICEVWGRTANIRPPDSRGMNLHAVAYLDHAPNSYRATPWAPNSFHPGGVHIVLGDGSVRFISENIHIGTLKGLATIAGNEVLGGF
jgi:prepilin-type N-terminal cleavage/methylation domain-containing protein